MKFSIQTNIWKDEIHQEHMAQMLHEIASAGYDGLEIGAHRIDLDDPAGFKVLVIQEGLQVSGIHTHGDLANPQEMEGAYSRIAKAASYAAEVRAPFLLISGKPKHSKSETDKKNEVEALEKAGRICQNVGIKLCYHNHYWEIEHDASGLAFLCEHTDPDLVGLALDVGWVHRAGGRPAEVTLRFIDRIQYFHFKDFRVKDFLNDTWTELGEGYVDFFGVMEVIRGRCDFWLTYERDEALDNASESAHISRSYMDRLFLG